MSWSRSARFSEGRTRDLAWMPVLRAFMEEVALPVTEVGPVDCWALRRLASICRRLDIVVRGVRVALGLAGGSACPTLRIEGGFRGFGVQCLYLIENREKRLRNVRVTVKGFLRFAAKESVREGDDLGGESEETAQ